MEERGGQIGRTPRPPRAPEAEMAEKTTTQTATETPAETIARLQAELASARAAAKTAKASERAAAATPHDCECGCGAQTIRPEARFRPGHDATLKSALIRAVLRGDSPKASAAEKAAGAEAETKLETLGWADHLAISRKAAAAKRKPKAAPKPAPTPAAPSGAAGSDGRTPESVGKLTGKVGRKS